MRMRISMKSSVELLRERGIGRGHPVQLYIAQSAIRRMRKYTPQDTKTMAGSAQAANAARRFTSTRHTPKFSTKTHISGIVASRRTTGLRP